MFTVDTDFLFPETARSCERIVEKYGVDAHRVQRRGHARRAGGRHGLALYERDTDLLLRAAQGGADPARASPGSTRGSPACAATRASRAPASRSSSATTTTTARRW